jgi:hypothetical protein
MSIDIVATLPQYELQHVSMFFPPFILPTIIRGVTVVAVTRLYLIF